MAVYEYPVLFESFFKNLGIEVIYSNATDKEILEDGKKFSVDEACLASKIYLGHVYNLVKRAEKENIDYIFIPRICSFKGNETVCVKFYAMYDICKNLFDFNFVTLNIDYKKNQNELVSFLKLGKSLNKNLIKTFIAYKKAKSYEKSKKKELIKKQKERLYKERNNIKILIVSHPYIVYDEHIGKPIQDYLKRLGVKLYYSNINDETLHKKLTKYQKYSKTLYWRFSKNLLNGITEYIDKIDGIIYLSAFPCGPDSLVTELAVRKIDSVPSINIILDEQDGSAGIYTRLESFVDILEQRIALKEEVI